MNECKPGEQVGIREKLEAHYRTKYSNQQTAHVVEISNLQRKLDDDDGSNQRKTARRIIALDRLINAHNHDIRFPVDSRVHTAMAGVDKGNIPLKFRPSRSS